MKKLLFAALALGLIGAGCSSASAPASTTVTYKTYSDPACNVSFEYPSDWTNVSRATSFAGVTLVNPATLISQLVNINSDFQLNCFNKYSDFATANGYAADGGTPALASNLAGLVSVLTKGGADPRWMVNGPVTVDGQAGTGLTTGNQDNSTVANAEYHIYLEHGGEIYDLGFLNNTADTSAKLSAASAHILSSFKFAK